MLDYQLLRIPNFIQITLLHVHVLHMCIADLKFTSAEMAKQSTSSSTYTSTP